MSVAEILKELPKLSAEEREAVERKLGEIRGRGSSSTPALKESLVSLKKPGIQGVQKDPATWQSRIRKDRSILEDEIYETLL